jgi:NitT/TauT family transport system ATP-binding protein
MTTMFDATLSHESIILSASRVSKSFRTPEGTEVRVLDEIDLELREGEIVALLGPSGSGKSTLLRILISLLRPSSGDVRYRGRPVTGPMPGLAMVFQTFALFPWLTVLQNIELGLEPQGVPAAERRRRALEAIDLIGLDGFESAYPRELSGGMRQRVGFARALVTRPDVLLMDEPFLALDVLTAENLRRELRDLWLTRRIPTRAMLIVTHNLDEAVFLADRLLVLVADPGRIRAEVPGLPVAKRDHRGPEHVRLVDILYRIMTNPEEDVATLLPAARSVQAPPMARPYQALPQVSIGGLTGFVERLAVLGRREDLYRLARDLQMDVDDLFPLIEAADLLSLADIQEGDVFLTEMGYHFAEAGVLEKKELFRHQALTNIALVRRIVHDLQASPTHTMRAERMLEQLERSFSSEEARRQLDTAIDWGRYAELFAYDDNTDEFSLEEEEPTTEAE